MVENKHEYNGIIYSSIATTRRDSHYSCLKTVLMNGVCKENKSKHKPEGL